LIETKLQGTLLDATNFQSANMSKANLENAHYNKHTIFPDSFDPGAAGAIKVDDAA